MTTPDRTAEPPRGAGLGPFTVMGAVVALAVGGAVWEMSYYTSAPGLSAGALGTTLGIVAAVVVLFVLAFTAPPNE